MFSLCVGTVSAELNTSTHISGPPDLEAIWVILEFDYKNELGR